MNFFDIVALAIVALSVYCGYQIGVIASFFYVVSGFVGIWAAQKFSPQPGMNFYLVFFAGVGVVILTGFFISKLLKKLFVEWADRLIGAFIGLALGFVIVGTVVVPLSYHMPKNIKQYVVSSFSGTKFIPKLQAMFPKVEQFRLQDIKDKIPGEIDLKLKVPFVNEKDNK
jgi:uncharacterized membrane protein required for colicin V production